MKQGELFPPTATKTKEQPWRPGGRLHGATKTENTFVYKVSKKYKYHYTAFEYIIVSIQEEEAQHWNAYVFGTDEQCTGTHHVSTMFGVKDQDAALEELGYVPK